MYLKDFLLVGRRCEGRALTLEEWGEVIRTSDISDYRIRKDVWEVFANTKEMRLATSLSFEELSDPSKLPHGEMDII